IALCKSSARASCGCRAIHPLTKSKRFFALIDKVFAWDHRRERVVYRIPGHRHDDGREDSDLSPVWLAAQPDDLPEGVAVKDLRKVDVDE
ncbi:hypothetical protein, partial [Halomonas sp. BC1]|uniref:hypothetical protein n=1 Tax=Halomonas sp. BC1 TaxID=1670448 RepID=UPI0020CB65CF